MLFNVMGYLHELLLQWGREHVLAEIHNLIAANTSPLFASMGPRARARGNALQRHGLPARTPASMGPRARARGNSQPDRSEYQSALRFNGAASTCSRKCSSTSWVTCTNSCFNGAASTCSRKFTT